MAPYHLILRGGHAAAPVSGWSWCCQLPRSWSLPDDSAPSRCSSASCVRRRRPGAMVRRLPDARRAVTAGSRLPSWCSASCWRCSSYVPGRGRQRERPAQLDRAGRAVPAAAHRSSPSWRWCCGRRPVRPQARPAGPVEHLLVPVRPGRSVIVSGWWCSRVTCGTAIILSHGGRRAVRRRRAGSDLRRPGRSRAWRGIAMLSHDRGLPTCDRFRGWLDPESDPPTCGWQVTAGQGRTGRRWLVGVGLGGSREKWGAARGAHRLHLPVIGEELGVIGSVPGRRAVRRDHHLLAADGDADHRPVRADRASACVAWIVTPGDSQPRCGAATAADHRRAAALHLLRRILAACRRSMAVGVLMAFARQATEGATAAAGDCRADLEVWSRCTSYSQAAGPPDTSSPP